LRWRAAVARPPHLLPSDKPQNDSRDPETVAGFGREWSTYDQMNLGVDELEPMFDQYFSIFPWATLTREAKGIDVGCGSGRWARLVATRVGHLTCADASVEAVAVAARALVEHPNTELVVGSAGALPFEDGTFDFGYALGVLHHTPDPGAALADCVRVLRHGSPLLVYLYYALDGRPGWYRTLWRMSDALRRCLSRRSFRTKLIVSNVVAATCYWPLSRSAWLLERLGVPKRRVETIPLSFYRGRSFYVMRTDALDRLGTRIEHRFTRPEVERILSEAGLGDIVLSEDPPYRVAVGHKRAP
jgi:ubiquinone/menaquinone biosynthesis C-methylase UbiE